MAKETVKIYQKTKKEIQAEKKLNSFTSNIQSHSSSITSSPISVMSQLEKLRSAINKVCYLTPSEIKLNENVRSEINTSSEEFIALKNSIATQGILQPAVVELREKNNEEYDLIAINGHRRIVAAQQLGMEKILCVLKKYTEKDSRLLHGLTENLLRSDLEPLDIADGYSNLIKLGWKYEDVADYFGKDKNYVYCIIKISGYSNEAKKIIRENKDKFSMRVLVNEFSRKKWDSEKKLLDAINSKAGLLSTEQTSKQSKQEKNRKLLNSFYEMNPKMQKDVKEHIEKALKYFKIL